MKNLLKVVTVLGVPYAIHEGTTVDFPALKDCDGYCDTSTKEIVVSKMKKWLTGSLFSFPNFKPCSILLIA